MGSMSQETYQIHLGKEAFKFSSAHMTVFPDGTKESLHGHNYRVQIHFDFKSFAFAAMVPFADLKSPVSALCKEWDEKVLLATQCPFMEVKSEKGTEVEFLLCKKRYVLPKEDVLFLTIENITAEELAQEFTRQLLGRISPLAVERILGISVTIEESTGQGATVSRRI